MAKYETIRVAPNTPCPAGSLGAWTGPEYAEEMRAVYERSDPMRGPRDHYHAGQVYSFTVWVVRPVPANPEWGEEAP